ncbi:MAG: CBS domain-containing protein [Candidatus Xenobia bacterium]
MALQTHVTATDCMHRDVVSIHADMQLPDIARTFVRNGISGAPVIESDGRLVGVISQTDLVRQLARPETQPDPMVYPDFYSDWISRRLVEEDLVQYEHIAPTTARQLCNRKIYQVDEHTSIPEIVDLMLRTHIHRVIVTRDQKPVGIVTTSDLIRLLPGLLLKP